MATRVNLLESRSERELRIKSKIGRSISTGWVDQIEWEKCQQTEIHDRPGSSDADPGKEGEILPQAVNDASLLPVVLDREKNIVLNSPRLISYLEKSAASIVKINAERVEIQAPYMLLFHYFEKMVEQASSDQDDSAILEVEALRLLIDIEVGR
jgi:hypothetical protein